MSGKHVQSYVGYRTPEGTIVEVQSEGEKRGRLKAVGLFTTEFDWGPKGARTSLLELSESLLRHALQLEAPGGMPQFADDVVRNLRTPWTLTETQIRAWYDQWRAKLPEWAKCCGEAPVAPTAEAGKPLERHQ